MNPRMASLAVAAILAAAAAHGAQPPADAASASQAVETRAVVRSVSEEGGALYIRLQLVPGAKLPFTTLTYRVLDRRLVANVRQGDSVAFRARRIDGENVLVALRAAPR